MGTGGGRNGFLRSPFIHREGEQLRDRQNGKSDFGRTRPSSIRFWISRHCIPASYWQREFRIISDLHSDDGRSWSDELNSAFTWATYRVIITVFSVTGTALGVGQLLVKILGY